MAAEPEHHPAGPSATAAAAATDSGGADATAKKKLPLPSLNEKTSKKPDKKSKEKKKSKSTTKEAGEIKMKEGENENYNGDAEDNGKLSKNGNDSDHHHKSSSSSSCRKSSSKNHKKSSSKGDKTPSSPVSSDKKEKKKKKNSSSSLSSNKKESSSKKKQHKERKKSKNEEDYPDNEPLETKHDHETSIDFKTEKTLAEEDVPNDPAESNDKNNRHDHSVSQADLAMEQQQPPKEEVLIDLFGMEATAEGQQDSSPSSSRLDLWEFGAAAPAVSEISSSLEQHHQQSSCSVQMPIEVLDHVPNASTPSHTPQKHEEIFTASSTSSFQQLPQPPLDLLNDPRHEAVNNDDDGSVTTGSDPTVTPWFFGSGKIFLDERGLAAAGDDITVSTQQQEEQLTWQDNKTQQQQEVDQMPRWMQVETSGGDGLPLAQPDGLKMTGDDHPEHLGVNGGDTHFSTMNTIVVVESASEAAPGGPKERNGSLSQKKKRRWFSFGRKSQRDDQTTSPA